MTQIKTLTLTPRGAYTAIPENADQEMIALATLQAAEKEDDDARVPVDVVCVLDRSGSMSGEKLNLCKKTLVFLISNVLSSADRLGLVVFGLSFHDYCYTLTDGYAYIYIYIYIQTLMFPLSFRPSL